MGDVLRELSKASRPMQSLQSSRLSIEACENFHFHWRGVRLEASFEDAVRLGIAMQLSFKRLLEDCQGKVVLLPLASICPWNGSHRRPWNFSPPDVADEHLKGAEFFCRKIGEGRRPWPIAVRPWTIGGWPRSQDREPGMEFQRLDGFKRYHGARLAKKTHIECFVLDADIKGCQDRERFPWDPKKPQFGIPHALVEPGDPVDRYHHENLFTRLAKVKLGVDHQRPQGDGRVELLRNGQIHVHVGDVRLEMTRDEFVAYAEMIQQGRRSLG